MSDRELIDATVWAARDERRATAHLIALLAEVDARRLYLGEGCSSMFTYCTQVLRLSEHAAYHRIEAARAARPFPMIFEQLASGELTLTTVAMLRPHLTEENRQSLFVAARYKSKREVEQQIACLAPRPEATALIRRAGLDAGGEVDASAYGDACAKAAGPRAKVTSLASDRYLLRVTLSAAGDRKSVV